MTDPSRETLASPERSKMQSPSKNIRNFFATSKIILFPALISLVTTYRAVTSTHRYSPLRLVSSEHGILILHIMSKAGDIALTTAAKPFLLFLACSKACRNETVAASRTDMTLLKAKSLGKTLVQHIPPEDFFQAYDAILTPLDQVDDGGNCSSLTPQSQLTQYLYIYLNQSAYTPNLSVNTPREYLCNLLATPLYLCNPLMLTSGDSADDIQEGLPPQNYLRGSYAIPTQRAEVGSWTAWTYVALYGAILLLMLIVSAVISGYETPKSSHFPIADFLISMKPKEMIIGHDESERESVKIHSEDIFVGIEPGDNKEILRRADEIRLRLV
ncbi:hypothetical protein NHQ30_003443 [Ciborinia camelliae]|nr:hypothetical protein NHQ30_003443 [Ciborinia camelliae]